MTLKYETDRTPDELRIRLQGDLDFHVASALRQELQKHLDDPPATVIVDLAKVPFVDSSIIATLVEALKLIRAKGANLRVDNCQPAVRDAFEITRLLKSFGIE